MGKVSNNTYSHIRSREQIAEDKSVEKKGSLENKKGALASLNSKFANFQAKITGGEKRARATISEPLNKKAMSEKLQNIRSERSPSTSTHNAKGRQSQPIKNGPPPPSYVPTPPTQKQLDAIPKDSPPPYSLHDPLGKSGVPTAKHNDPQSGINKKQTVQLSKAELKAATAMKETVTKAISNYLKDGDTNDPYKTENFPKLLAALDKCLGLSEGKPTLGEVSLLQVMSDNIQRHMPDQIGELDNILEKTMQQLFA